jgi:hypothetical protein
MSVVVTVVLTTVPEPFRDEYVTTENVSSPAGTPIEAVHFVVPLTTAHPGSPGAKLIFTGATVGGRVPFTATNLTTSDCVAGPVAGNATENDAVPVLSDRADASDVRAGSVAVLPPPWHAASKTATGSAANKKTSRP